MSCKGSTTRRYLKEIHVFHLIIKGVIFFKLNIFVIIEEWKTTASGEIHGQNTQLVHNLGKGFLCNHLASSPQLEWFVWNNKQYKWRCPTQTQYHGGVPLWRKAKSARHGELILLMFSFWGLHKSVKFEKLVRI
jgi:hypothetical protein